MRERGKHESVRLRYSSLYSVVEALGREVVAHFVLFKQS
jgi:hypothetical protein